MEIKSQFEYDNKIAYVTYRDTNSFENLASKNVTQVYAICFLGNKIVLVHNKNQNALSLPGGGLENNETFEDCLKREIKEETNMKVVSFAPIGYQEVTDNGSPAVFQLRYICIVEPYGDFISDPDGDVDEIKMIAQEEFKVHIKWGEVGDRLFKRALELKEKIQN
jgi:ADP-ribose pyrophosphatase YjhB (NUDIX family)